jgi:hypothetical protein
MQPVFQIPGDLLEAHVARLRKSPAIQSCEGILHACLFLTGLRVAAHYCRAAQTGSEFFTNWEPSHYLDDGVPTMARRSLKFLMRKVRSRGIKEDTRVMFPDGAPNPNLFAVQLSFANLLSHAPKTVLTWISSGDPTENKIRLSCAMGVLALWSSDTLGFIHDLMAAPVRFRDDIIAEAMHSFTLTPEKLLPELT